MTTLAGQRLPPVPGVVAQWLRFAAVGVSNTVISVGLYALLLHAGVHYLVASAMAFVVATANSYALNRRWTFRSGGRPAPEAARFFAVSASGLGVNALLLAGMVEVLGVPSLPAQLVVIPVVSVLTFAMNRRWTFPVPAS